MVGVPSFTLYCSKVNSICVVNVPRKKDKHINFDSLQIDFRQRSYVNTDSHLERRQCDTSRTGRWQSGIDARVWVNEIDVLFKLAFVLSFISVLRFLFALLNAFKCVVAPFSYPKHTLREFERIVSMGTTNAKPCNAIPIWIIYYPLCGTEKVQRGCREGAERERESINNKINDTHLTLGGREPMVCAYKCNFAYEEIQFLLLSSAVLPDVLCWYPGADTRSRNIEFYFRQRKKNNKFRFRFWLHIRPPYATARLHTWQRILCVKSKSHERNLAKKSN